MQQYTIFGFGSLISTKSLQSSAPNSQPRAAYIKGFRRSFSLWDPEGFTTTNLDVGGIPFCALDISKIDNSEARVNGVAFSVDQVSFEALQKRESEYELIETTCYDFDTGNQLGKCLVYSANKNNGSFEQNSKAQERYLEVCLEGAREYSEAFYREFLNTTFIGNVPLSKIAKYAQ